MAAGLRLFLKLGLASKSADVNVPPGLGGPDMRHMPHISPSLTNASGEAQQAVPHSFQRRPGRTPYHEAMQVADSNVDVLAAFKGSWAPTYKLPTQDSSIETTTACAEATAYLLPEPSISSCRSTASGHLQNTLRSGLVTVRLHSSLCNQWGRFLSREV